ncbi:sulfotransferase family protein [Alterinioella nitratireducens]|uniref:sulfotransferase family protein n=1 Tax=Alterinioella nitratireducens TaxID=2735915 RepID=UPI0015540BAD|nr:sulfotransferase [Alterinioella nitratireducens]NPD18064.1 sulfotransferase [Alterinioella nitratireducens]
MGDATLLFGIGAAKAGTTWLYRFLAAHPEVRLPAVKELHYFDTAETSKFDRQIARMRKEKARRTGRLPTGDEKLDRRLKREIWAYNRWLNVIADPSDAAYVDFLTHNAGDARVVGDITPAYATLSEASLTRMAGLADKTRFIYLMRDPLDRLWSNIRMAAARRTGALRETAGALLDKVVAGEDQTITARSNYALTLARVNAALDPRTVFLGFYETLFQPETVARICDFLGITPRAAKTQARVLAGEDLTMTEGQRARALAWLAPQYDAVRGAMGALPQRWTDNMEALA